MGGPSPSSQARDDTRAGVDSQRQLHSIVGNAHVDATLGGHDPEFRRELALVTGDNLRAAMSDDGSRYAFFFAPRQLGTNRRMANERFVAASNERTRYSSAIANVNLQILERRSAVMDKYEIRDVKDRRTTGAHAISDSRSKNGVFNCKRFECDATNFRGCTLLNQMPIFDMTPR